VPDPLVVPTLAPPRLRPACRLVLAHAGNCITRSYLPAFGLAAAGFGRSGALLPWRCCHSNIRFA
jgi:hypothetical protein